MKVREDVAAMLRDGAPYRAIQETLGVSRHAISETRRHFRIPNAATGPGRRIAPEDRPALEQRVVELALAGATNREIEDEAGITHPTIAAIRRKHGVPKTVRPRFAPNRRTIAAAFTLHTRTDDDGHVHWTGPRNGRMPALTAENGRHNARHVAFRMHHGRAPDGYVLNTPTCTASGCIAGAHLTDHTIRNPPTTDPIDALHDAIFGSDQ
jgi:uncharacterized protein YerC